MISVIIPVYNAELHLEKCLESIFDQTYTAFELLLIDDGSSDASGMICDRYARKDPRVRVFHQANGGVSSARNLGMKESRGDFITFIDADDWIDADYLKQLWTALKENSADISICAVFFEREGEPINKFLCNQAVLTSAQALELLLSRREINSGPYAKLFKREIIQEVTFPKLKAYEDILFVMNAFDRSKRVANAHTVYHYRENEEGAMHCFFKQPSLDIVVASEEILYYLKCQNKGLTDYPFYITLSHLMQYVQVIRRNCQQHSEEGHNFLIHVRQVYRKYSISIIRCAAFSWKEKVLFLFYGMGLI